MTEVKDVDFLEAAALKVAGKIQADKVDEYKAMLLERGYTPSGVEAIIATIFFHTYWVSRE